MRCPRHCRRPAIVLGALLTIAALAEPEWPTGGIGATVTSKDGWLEIVNLLAGGAAASDGRLQPGDRITHVTVDGQRIGLHGLPLAEAVALLRGAAGSSVQLEAERKGQEIPLQVRLERRQLPTSTAAWSPTVSTASPGDGRGVVTVTRFIPEVGITIRQSFLKGRDGDGPEAVNVTMAVAIAGDELLLGRPLITRTIDVAQLSADGALTHAREIDIARELLAEAMRTHWHAFADYQPGPGDRHARATQAEQPMLPELELRGLVRAGDRALASITVTADGESRATVCGPGDQIAGTDWRLIGIGTDSVDVATQDQSATLRLDRGDAASLARKRLAAVDTPPTPATQAAIAAALPLLRIGSYRAAATKLAAIRDANPGQPAAAFWARVAAEIAAHYMPAGETP